MATMLAKAISMFMRPSRDFCRIGAAWRIGVTDLFTALKQDRFNST